MSSKATTSGRDVTADLAFLTRALKAPTLREAVGRLAEGARSGSDVDNSAGGIQCRGHKHRFGPVHLAVR